MKHFLLLGLLINFAITDVSLATENKVAKCAAAWEALYASAGLKVLNSPGSVLADANEFSHQCEGTGVHEAKLSGLYLLKGEYDKAKLLLTNAHRNEISTPYIELANVELEFQLYAHSPEIDAAKANRLEDEYAAITKKHPKWPNGWAALGNYLILRGKYEASAEAFQTSAKLGMANELLVQRGLAISYAYSRQYGPALEAGDKAINISKEIYGDPEFMLSAAWLRLAVGRPKVAKQLLMVLEDREPTVVDNPNFRKAVAATQRALQQSE